MSDALNPKDVLAHIEQVRGETLKYFEPLTQEQLDFRPSPSTSGEEEWSLGEVFMHLALDEYYLRENIARPLLEGVQPPEGVFFIPPIRPEHGVAKDVIRFWFERARAVTRRLIEDLPGDANLALKHAGGLDPMNGLEWFMGYAGHEAYHHKQIEAVIAEISGVAAQASAD